MNYGAEICSKIIDEGMHDVDAIRDRIGLAEKTFDHLVGKLCGEGTLRRERDRLVIANHGRALVLSEQAQANTVPAASTLPRTLPEPPAAKQRKLRVELPALEVKIEKAVPIPPKRFGRAARIIPWPFKTMEVGDSFAIPVPEGFTPQEVAAALRRDADTFGRVAMPDLRVTVRIEEGDKTVRLWREQFEKEPVATPAPPTKVASLGIRARKVGRG
jgi:hypothetical protein